MGCSILSKWPHWYNFCIHYLWNIDRTDWRQNLFWNYNEEPFLNNNLPHLAFPLTLPRFVNGGQAAHPQVWLWPGGGSVRPPVCPLRVSGHPPTRPVLPVQGHDWPVTIRSTTTAKGPLQVINKSKQTLNSQQRSPQLWYIQNKQANTPAKEWVQRGNSIKDIQTTNCGMA